MIHVTYKELLGKEYEKRVNIGGWNCLENWRRNIKKNGSRLNLNCQLEFERFTR